MSVLTKEASVIGTKAYPAISILLPTHTPEVGVSNFRERLSQLLRNVEQQLAKKYSKLKTSGLMGRLHHVVNGIELSATGPGLAIFVSDAMEKVFHLPFQVTEKIVIDDSFEVRDLLFAAKLNRNYLLVLISSNKVSTLMGYGKSLLTFEMEGMPDNVKDMENEHSFPGWDYVDTKAYHESNLNNFIQFIDTVIDREMKGKEIPVIIMGDPKILGHYRKTTKMPGLILDYIEGNFDHASKHELLNKIEPALHKLGEQQERKALNDLSDAVKRNQMVAGISQVWRVAAEARGRILIVEKEYREAARLGEDGYTLLLDKEVGDAHNRIEDAVDDIIEMVLKHKGDVVFVPEGALKDYQRIAMVTRY